MFTVNGAEASTFFKRWDTFRTGVDETVTAPDVFCAMFVKYKILIFFLDKCISVH